MIGINIKSGGIGKKILSMKATIDKKYCENFDLDFFSTYICKFFQNITNL